MGKIRSEGIGCETYNSIAVGFSEEMMTSPGSDGQPRSSEGLVTFFGSYGKPGISGRVILMVSTEAI